MSLKQTIESHPVVVYLTALLVGGVAGYNLYPILPPPGRASVSTDDVQKMKERQAPKVISNGIDMIYNEVCKGENPYHVKEKYALVSPGDPMSFVLIEGTSSHNFKGWRVDEKSAVLRVDETVRGWTINYCAGKGFSADSYRRFFNPSTGELSEPLLVKIKIP